MFELIDTTPDANVEPAEYTRLLGFPPHKVLEDRSRELADWARDWYAKHGRPWIYARQVGQLELSSGAIGIDGSSFTSKRLLDTLRQADAHSAFVVAISAGEELEKHAHEVWTQEKPDEYFFLEIYGSAVVERLTTVAGAKLCAWADTKGLAILPHYSPGYPEWDIIDQAALLELIDPKRLPGSLKVFDTGMLLPKKSLLGVFGVTRHVDRVKRLSDLVPCHSCSFGPCEYRRAPYRGAMVAMPEIESLAAPLARNAKYSTNAKALARWAGERLSLTPHDDGSIHACFRYDGTTCTNMGRPLTFHYDVILGSRSEGYPIREARCAPAPGDAGHRAMCKYIENADRLMSSIEREKPLVGQKLNDVLTWKRASNPAGCYCDESSREHKWGLVLETIHFALANAEL
jgi:hypothetical protein